MANQEPLIELRSLSYTVGSQKILHNINLSVSPSEILTIIGPNGAGKSSLLKLIAGLKAPTDGAFVRKNKLKLAYVPQKLAMDKALPMKVSRFLSLTHAQKHEYRDALTQVKADHLWAKQMHELSGGEFQRVLLARAIARRPELLLLDEPLQGVDVVGQIELYRLIATLRDSLNCSIIMVSHDLHLVMAQCDRVLCLNQHICCEGRPESVSQHPEYLSLFGKNSAEELAVYTHHHDHHHDLDGNVVSCSEQCHHD